MKETHILNLEDMVDRSQFRWEWGQ